MSKRLLPVLFLMVMGGGVAIGTSAAGLDNCGGPSYRIAWDYSRAPARTAIVVSVASRYATAKYLIALACEIKSDYPKSNEIAVDVFNDWTAAKRTTNIHSVEGHAIKGANKDAYVAYLYVDRTKNIETLTLVVDADHPCGNDIQIDLKHRRLRYVSCE